jgi:hypothetical protein
MAFGAPIQPPASTSFKSAIGGICIIVCAGAAGMVFMQAEVPMEVFKGTIVGSLFGVGATLFYDGLKNRRTEEMPRPDHSPQAE